MSIHGYLLDCVRCGCVLSPGSRFIVCGVCKRADREKHLRPQHATHIAGYVPPKGSIAFMLLGRLVNPIQGLGI